MPPPRRDSAVPEPARRGSRYLSCASSTCHLPSRVRARLRENVEDELRAIDHFAIDPRFDLPQLSRRQLVVEDDDVGGDAGAFRRELVELAAADEGGRVGRRTLLNHLQHDGCAGRLGEPGELLERVFRVVLLRSAKRQTDERGSFARPAVAPCGARVGMASECHIQRSKILARAPTRSRRRERAPDTSPVASTIVDGRPPGVGPASINTSMRSPSDRTTSSGVDAGGSPEILALVDVIA